MSVNSRARIFFTSLGWGENGPETWLCSVDGGGTDEKVVGRMGITEVGVNLGSDAMREDGGMIPIPEVGRGGEG